jgi:hypothetical protein
MFGCISLWENTESRTSRRGIEEKGDEKARQGCKKV